jgi:hypothetical protein
VSHKANTELRPAAGLLHPKVTSALEVLRCHEPVGPVVSMQSLIEKGLLPAPPRGRPPSLPKGLFLETCAGQHNMESGQMFELGVSESPRYSFLDHKAYGALITYFFIIYVHQFQVLGTD